MIRRSRDPAQERWTIDPSFHRLLSSIGRHSFYEELRGTLGQIYDARHIYVCLMDGARPDILSALSCDGSDEALIPSDHYMRNSLWRVDADMLRGGQVDDVAPQLFQFDAQREGAREIRDLYRHQRLRERLMLCGRESFGVVGLCVLRPADCGVIGPEGGRQLDCAINLIYPMVAKHLEVTNQSRRMIQALTSLKVIEDTIACAGEGMPPREQQVAARFLYGLSASSIAVDLGVAQETVLTHRKRLYDRLSIGCHRELLLWYLNLHARVNSAITEPLRFSA